MDSDIRLPPFVGCLCNRTNPRIPHPKWPVQTTCGSFCWPVHRFSPWMDRATYGHVAPGPVRRNTGESSTQRTGRFHHSSSGGRVGRGPGKRGSHAALAGAWRPCFDWCQCFSEIRKHLCMAGRWPHLPSGRMFVAVWPQSNRFCWEARADFEINPWVE